MPEEPTDNLSRKKPMELKPPAELAKTLESATNATLIFEVSDGALSYDDWGNPVVGTSTVELEAVIHSRTQVDASEYLPGIDQRMIPVRGRLVSPKSFDGTGITHLSEGNITFSNGTSGRIKLSLPVPNPYDEVVSTLGQKFEAFIDYST